MAFITCEGVAFTEGFLRQSLSFVASVDRKTVENNDENIRPHLGAEVCAASDCTWRCLCYQSIIAQLHVMLRRQRLPFTLSQVNFT